MNAQTRSRWRLDMFRQSWRKFLVAGLLIPVLLTTGCFGRFPLTKATYRLNDDVSQNEFWENLAFWGLTATLIYPAMLVTDLVVLNTIEFWSGETIDLGEDEYRPTHRRTRGYEDIESRLQRDLRRMRSESVASAAPGAYILAEAPPVPDAP